jgi:hypothetical protein
MGTDSDGLIVELVKQSAMLQTLLEGQQASLTEIKEDLKALKKEVNEDARELEKLKNRGSGLLVGLGIFATTTATFFSEYFVKLKHFIFG